MRRLVRTVAAAAGLSLLLASQAFAVESPSGTVIIDEPEVPLAPGPEGGSEAAEASAGGDNTGVAGAAADGSVSPKTGESDMPIMVAGVGLLSLVSAVVLINKEKQTA